MSAARLTVTSSGSLTPGRYASFSRLRGDLLGLVVGAGAELDLERRLARAARRPRCPSSRRRSPPPCAAAAGRRATPTAARCSARSGRSRSRRGAGDGLLGAREGQRAAGAQLDLARADPPAAADVLGAVHGDRQHGGARSRARGGRRRASGAPASPAGSGCPRGRCTTVPPRSTASARGLHRGLVGLAAADREGAEAVEEPALPALLEQLDLGDELDLAAPRQRARRSRTGRGSCGGSRRRSGRP